VLAECIYPGGNRYEGPWDKGFRHGADGVMTWATGEHAGCRWEGPWWQDKMHGVGLWRKGNELPSWREYRMGEKVRTVAGAEETLLQGSDGADHAQDSHE